MKQYVLTFLLGIVPVKAAYDFNGMCKIVGRAVLTAGAGTGCLLLACAANGWACADQNHYYDDYCDHHQITPPALAVAGLSLVPWYYFIDNDFPNAVIAVSDWVENKIIAVAAWLRHKNVSKEIIQKNVPLAVVASCTTTSRHRRSSSS